MMISYGHQIAPQGDVYVTIADRTLAAFGQAAIFGTYLVDYLSFRKYQNSITAGVLILDMQ